MRIFFLGCCFKYKEIPKYIIIMTYRKVENNLSYFWNKYKVIRKHKRYIKTMINANVV